MRYAGAGRILGTDTEWRERQTAVTNVIDDYVAELGQALRGPRRPRIELLTETRDSLDDAARAYEHAGLDRRSAELRAVADFGEVRTIAAAYRDELAIGQTRRTALLMFCAVGIQPMVWQAWWPWFASEPSSATAGVYSVVNEAVEWLGAVTILAAFLAVLAFGIGGRYVDPRRYGIQPRPVAIASLALCAVFAALGVTMGALSPDQTLAAGLMWLALFLLAPLSVVTAAARRCLSLA